MSFTPTRVAPPWSDVKLVVFDLDGTLVDAFADIALLLNQALRHWGYPEHPVETVKSFVGDGASVLLRRALGEAGTTQFDEIYPWYRALYEANHGNTVTVYPGAAETLSTLKVRGIKVAVLTNKPHGVTGSLLSKVGLSGLIEEFWGQVDGSPQKPDAEALLQVARFFDVEPGEVVMVGDGPADLAVARHAGARAVAVTFGQLSRTQVQALRPDAVIDSLSELPGLIG